VRHTTGLVQRRYYPRPVRRGEVSLAIRPGTRIKRGDRLVLIEELSVGHDVHVQATESTTEIL
jgi:hypothetical protein